MIEIAIIYPLMLLLPVKRNESFVKYNLTNYIHYIIMHLTNRPNTGLIQAMLKFLVKKMRKFQLRQLFHIHRLGILCTTRLDNSYITFLLKFCKLA